MTEVPPQFGEPPSSGAVTGYLRTKRAARAAAEVLVGTGRSVLDWSFPRRSPSDTESDRKSARPTSKLDVYLLTLPLAVAIVNPGTGFFSGFYAAILVGAYLVLKYWWRTRFTAIDWVAGLAFVYVTISPLWAYNASYTVPASRGDAVSIAYFLVVRRVIIERDSFILFARVTAALTSVYAIYFLLSASAYDLATSRIAVGFANANYTGAVLAYGGTLAIWLAFHIDKSRRGIKIAWICTYAIHFIAIFASGSRASLAGTLGALVGVMLLRWWRHTWITTALLLVAGFIIGFFPQATGIFRWTASILAGFGPFTRSDAAAADLSGRAEIWESTREVIAQAPLFGSGSEGYRTRADVPVLAHSWGLEYAASVGVIGTSILVVVLATSFAGRFSGSASTLMPRAAIWNSATALSLLPSLMLSTHQWTLWAWVGFALWSRSYVLDEGDSSHTGEARVAATPFSGDTPASEDDRQVAIADLDARSDAPAQGAEDS